MMKLPALKAPIWLNVILIIIAVVIGGFCLLFGVAHIIEGVGRLVEGTPSDIPLGEQIKGWVFVLFLTVLGLLFVLLAAASAKGIDFQRNRK